MIETICQSLIVHIKRKNRRLVVTLPSQQRLRVLQTEALEARRRQEEERSQQQVATQSLEQAREKARNILEREERIINNPTSVSNPRINQAAKRAAIARRILSDDKFNPNSIGGATTLAELDNPSENRSTLQRNLLEKDARFSNTQQGREARAQRSENVRDEINLKKAAKGAGITEAEFESLNPQAKAALKREAVKGTLRKTGVDPPTPVKRRVNLTKDERFGQYALSVKAEADRLRSQGLTRGGLLAYSGIETEQGQFFAPRYQQNYFDFGTGKQVSRPTPEKVDTGFRTPVTSLAVEKLSGQDSIKTTFKEQQVATQPTKVRDLSTVKGRALEFFDPLSSDVQNTFTTTITPKTSAARSLFNSYVLPQYSDQRVDRLAPTSLQFQSTSLTKGKGRLSSVFFRLDKGLSEYTDPIVGKSGRFLLNKFQETDERPDSQNLNRRDARAVGFALKTIGEKPFTVATAAYSVLLTRGKLPLLAPAAAGVTATAVYTGTRRGIGRQEFQQYYQNPKFRSALSRTEYGGGSLVKLPFNVPLLGSEFLPNRERVRDYVRQEQFSENFASNLKQTGFKGNIQEAQAAARFESRTRAGGTTVGIVVAGEGSGNVVGGRAVKYFDRALKQQTYTRFKISKSVLTSGLGIGVGGFAEGSASSIVYDVARQERISPLRAGVSGVGGAFTAGTVGAGLGFFKTYKGGRFYQTSEDFANTFLDVPYETAGDIVTDLSETGKTTLRVPFTKYSGTVGIKTPVVTLSPEKDSFQAKGAPIDVSASTVSRQEQGFRFFRQRPKTTSRSFAPQQAVQTVSPSRGFTRTFTPSFDPAVPVEAQSRSLQQTTQPSQVLVPSRTIVPINTPSQIATRTSTSVPTNVLVNTRIDARTTVNTKVPSIVPVNVPVKVPTGGLPGFTPLGGGGRRFGSGKRRGRRRVKYTPSAYAIVTEFTGKKPGKLGLKSGLAVRPIDAATANKLKKQRF